MFVGQTPSVFLLNYHDLGEGSYAGFWLILKMLSSEELLVVLKEANKFS